MKKLLLGGALGLTLLATGAQAATVDFVAAANGNEGGAEDSTIGGITISSSHNAYLDQGGGLGVCKILNGGNQCNPASDDNVTSGEWVELSFGSAVTLSNIDFVADGHSGSNTQTDTLNGSMATLLFSINGGADQVLSFNALSMMSFNNVTTARFAYNDGILAIAPAVAGFVPGYRGDQFYVGAVTYTAPSAVPLPAAAPMLLAGLGGLAALRRRKKAA